MTNRFGRCSWQCLLGGMLCTAAWAWNVGESSATEVLLKDGRVLTGKLGFTTGLADMNQLEPNPNKDNAIAFLDDDLRRTFISKQQIVKAGPDTVGQVPEKFRLRQGANRTGPRVVTVGPFIHVTAFDEFGRRTFTMITGRGPVDVIQASPRSRPSGSRSRGSTTCGTCGSPPVRSPAMSAQDPDEADRSEEHRAAEEDRPILPAMRAIRGCAAGLEAIVADVPRPDRRSSSSWPRRSRRCGSRRAGAAEGTEAAARRRAAQFVQGLLKKFPSEDVPGETSRRSGR